MNYGEYDVFGPEEEIVDYFEDEDDYGYNENMFNKSKQRKMSKEGSKPQWRTDRKIAKKFKHEILGID